MEQVAIIGLVFIPLTLVEVGIVGVLSLPFDPG